jgi:cyclopropane-fatty-acyl-phospholipid synthase
MGFAESYGDGDWSSPDLAAFLILADENETALSGTTRALLPLRWLARVGHRSRRNSKRGSRRNIAAHYDLGNDFYARWLDPEMNYSSAIYRDGFDLDAAQTAKQARIIELLDLSAGKQVLEIGCGWGSLATAMARNGAEVVGLTLSREQRAFATNRVAAAGLSDKVELRLEDYRDTKGRFDRIVSIEMIEAVGEENWPLYFKRLAELLCPGGSAVLQAITIEEKRFETYRRGVDFIQQHIFPGGMLPTSAIIRREAERAGLIFASAEHFGDSYRRTLVDWTDRFRRAWPEIAALGFSERFRNLWEYYLAYCEAGFTTGAIDVGLYRLVRPA